MVSSAISYFQLISICVCESCTCNIHCAALCCAALHCTPSNLLSLSLSLSICCSLTALDAIVPKGSHVVAVALFDGELLYNTMHALQHPVGTTYQALYDFMNCEEENPCWGWLNSDPIVRANTTKISNSLNDVYQDIMDTQSFTNFEFIFYSPPWVTLFADYALAGYPLSNLIEPMDGFHPSQAGNALFGQKFYEFLVNEHPEALGPENPYNAEIDALLASSR